MILRHRNLKALAVSSRVLVEHKEASWHYSVSRVPPGAPKFGSQISGRQATVRLVYAFVKTEDLSRHFLLEVWMFEPSEGQL